MRELTKHSRGICSHIICLWACFIYFLDYTYDQDLSAPSIDSYYILSFLYLEKWARKTEIHFKFITVNLSLISWFTLDMTLLTIQCDVCTTNGLPCKRAVLYFVLRNVHSCKAIFWKYSGTMYRLQTSNVSSFVCGCWPDGCYSHLLFYFWNCCYKKEWRMWSSVMLCSFFTCKTVNIDST